MHDFPTFVDLLRYRSQSQPDRVAFSFLPEGETETERWTYGELDQKARAIAARLQAMGLSGERALLLYAPNLEFIAGFFGCLYANVTAVPAYPPRSAQMLNRLTAIIDDAQAAIALSSSTVIDNITQRMSRVGLTVQCLATDLIDPAEAAAWSHPNLKPEQLAFLQYTSGSTGNPKGVMVSHGNLIHNSQQINHSFEDTPETIGVSWLPPYHDMGLVGGILQPIYVGLKMVLMPPVAFLQRPTRWLSAISRWGGTTSGGPNFAYELCLKQIKPEQLETLDLSSWTLAFSGAEPVRAETIEAFSQTFAPCGFRKEAFFPCYGMAETTLIVTGASKAQEPVIEAYNDQALSENQAIAVDRQADDDSQRTLVSSGRPIADLKVAIVEPETGIQLPDNKVGEIWVASESVTQGYWGKPDLTQATFQAIPKNLDGQLLTEQVYLRTGDLGFLNQGELFVAGRLKDLIIIRGRNHYPQDIEASVQEAHPALRVGCAAAFSVEQSGQEKLVVVQEVERTWLRKLDVDEVTQAIRQAIVSHHQLQPDAILLLRTGGIPKTSSGKIQRFACRQRYLEDSLKVVGTWTPSETKLPTASLPQMQSPVDSSRHSSRQARAIQAWLVEKISAQTGVATINVNEPLSLYGLDSLAAVRLTADLEDWLMEKFERSHRLVLSPTLAYDYPTIQQLSAQVSALMGGGNEVAPSSPTAESGLATASDDIAVIGFGCRFPGAESPDAYWDLLKSGRSGISRLTDPDWQGDRALSRPAAIQGGFLPQVDQFDADFFGISAREAEQMDPQQRLLLEVAWESLEHARLPAETLAGSQTGVFVGISSSDYAQLKPTEQTSVYAGTGNAHSVAANRLSYVLDLRGPSLAVDTACSSSLVAIHLASQSLRQGDCRQAIAAGVNILLDAALTETFQQSGMLSPDGQCKTFDQDADGYVRGEGCGAVILKRLSDAERDGDQIWGVIRGSAINQDGRSNGLTAPNGRAQQAVIQQAIARARLTPNQISYVEAHGTGTSLGDPIEVNAIQQALSPGRTQDPCWIGSVKTNFGHLEAAAGVAGLIKVLLALNHKAIPPHLNFSTLNPLIQFEQTSFAIPTQLQAWSDPVRYAGISSFGFGGTNAHLIVSSAPESKQTPPRGDRPWHLLTLSAKSQTALQSIHYRYAEHLGHSPVTWGDLCTNTNTSRSALSQRSAFLAPSDIDPTLIQAALDSKNATPEAIAAAGLKTFTTLENSSSSPPCLAFLFTGQGAQYLEMGRELYQTSPEFRQTLNTCDALLKSSLQGQSLLEILYPETPQSETPQIDQTSITQPALFALEYALAQLWIRWGVHPDWVMGHSVGEYVAACIAGVFSLEDGLKLIAARAKLMETVPQAGGMLVVFAPPDWVQSQLDAVQEPLVIAAYNGPENTVVSGPEAAIAKFELTLNQQGQKSKRLSVSQAFHSPLMKAVIEPFKAVAQTITFHSPQIPIVSNLTSQPIRDEIATPEYWCNHILAPVRFSQSMTTLQAQGVTTLIEIGPKPTLIGMGRRCLPDNTHHWLPSLRLGRSDWQQLLDSLAQLYLQGLTIDWNQVDGDYVREKISLPTYPWQRQRYWLAGLGTSVSPAQPDFDSSVEQRYSREWQPLALPAHPSLRSGQWLFWGAKSDYHALQDELPAHQSLVLIKAGKQVAQKSRHWDVDSTSVESLTQLLRQLEAQAPILGLIDGRRLASNRHADVETAIQEQAELHFQTIALVRAIAQASTAARLWAIAPYLSPSSQPSNPSIAIHGSIAGLAKGIALEHPEHWGGLLLLNPESPVQTWRAIAQELSRSEALTESVILFDQDQRYAERLRLVVDHQPLTSSASPLCHSQGLYLITGGWGALGLETAQWLVNQGAKHLILVGRSQPSPEAQTTINRLRTQGISVKTVSLDLCQTQSLERLRQAIAATSQPLRGIIHAAGVLEDAMVMKLTQAQFKRVFEVKVKGGWILHELSLDATLDFFVCYSSVAAVLGSPGQSHYAAANAGLDALAAYRHTLGLAALSVNWGPWAEIGMATTDRASRSLQSFGFEFLSASHNFDHLTTLLHSASHASIGIFQVDWSTFQAHPGTQPLRPLLSEICPGTVSPQSPQQKGQLNGIDLLSLSREDRTNTLLNYLRQTLAQLMDVPMAEIQPQDHLMEMGTDSLMVMDAIALIQKDLDLMIYPREIYEHPHLDGLAHYLAHEFQRIHGPEDQSAPGNNPEPEAIQSALNQLAHASPSSTDYPVPDQKLPAAVFILSSPRAGSTLLRVMLAGHSRLFSPPELHLLPFGTMADRATDLKTSHLGEGLQRSLMDLGNLDAEASQSLIQKWEQEQKSIAEVYEDLQGLAGDRLLVDKSPTYGMQLETLKRAEALFENAKFIHLVRHPYAMIDSFVTLRMEKLIGMAEANPHQIAEEIWTRSNQNIVTFGQTVGDRYHQLSYETLVQTPQATLESLCEFLEIPFEPEILNPYSGDRLTDGVFQQSMSVGDPNFQKHSKIDPTLADRWQQVKLPHPLQTQTLALAQQLKYELPQPESSPSLSPATVETVVVQDGSLPLESEALVPTTIPVEMREHILHVRGLDICLCEWGPKDGTPVLCLHGILDQGLVWEPVAMALAKAGYRVIAPDLRGHGKSAHVGPGGAYHLMDFLGDVVTLVERIVDRPMYLVGHSLGSVVAGIFTRVRSQLVRHLILVEPVLPHNSQNEDLMDSMNTFLEYTLTPPKHTVMKDLAMAADRLRKAIPSLSLPFAKRLAERGTKPHGNGLIWRWDAILRARMSLTQQGGPITRDSYLRLLSEIQVPLTTVYGNDSTFNRPEDLDEQKAAIPHAKRVVIRGGHNLALDAPADLVRCILDAVPRLSPGTNRSTNPRATP